MVGQATYLLYIKILIDNQYIFGYYWRTLLLSLGQQYKTF